MSWTTERWASQPNALWEKLLICWQTTCTCASTLTRVQTGEHCTSVYLFRGAAGNPSKWKLRKKWLHNPWKDKYIHYGLSWPLCLPVTRQQSAVCIILVQLYCHKKTCPLSRRAWMYSWTNTHEQLWILAVLFLLLSRVHWEDKFHTCTDAFCDLS